jgi:cytochrome c-type biogenesis protein CcmE
MPVVFQGVKPGNFDQAEKIVVIGRYQEGAFHASQILVKCPSKYDDMASDKLEGKTADAPSY